MKAPIYLNHGDKIGFQKILDKEEYPINYKLFVQEEDKE
jgi:flagellar assembly factor FliW